MLFATRGTWVEHSETVTFIQKTNVGPEEIRPGLGSVDLRNGKKNAALNWYD